jgi:hypothetical protein
LKQNGLSFIKIVIRKHDFQHKILSHNPNAHIGKTCDLIQERFSATREESLPPCLTPYNLFTPFPKETVTMYIKLFWLQAGERSGTVPTDL